MHFTLATKSLSGANHCAAAAPQDSQREWDPDHIIEFVLVEAVTVQLVGNNPNMMYLRETCSQPDCPSKAAGANHDAAAERRLHFILLCEFKKRVRSRSVHDYKTCKQNATVTAYWRLPTNFTA